MPSPRLLRVGHAVSLDSLDSPTCFVFSSAVYAVWSQILFAKYEHPFECVLTYPRMRRRRLVFIDF